MTQDSIAVVIPVHNKAPFVARAIASVLAQTRPVDELILVDDASTDRSLDEIEAFRDSRIKLLQRGEAGPGGYAARNLAIRHATARWIAFLDADDTWDPCFVEEVAQLIARAPSRAGCVFTGYERDWGDRPAERDKYSAGRASDGFAQLDFDGFLSAWLTFDECPIWTSASAFRRDVLIQAGLFPERCRRGGDKDLWLRVMACADALSSPRVCATYHKATIHQVTRINGTNIRPCMYATIERMVRESSGKRRRLLMRVFNREVLSYARQVRQREHVSPAIYRGFFVRADPAGYAALLALSYLPLSMQAFLRRSLFWVRSLAQSATGDVRT
jgi:glycosyltransferase involved in cell wall biosynthesis